MHGFNQGSSLVRDIIDSKFPDIIMLQEHWLTPDNYSRFQSDFIEYYPFGSSALGSAVASGPLYGRPFGGTTILIKNELMGAVECIHASERFVIIRVGDILCINVYLPCAGTKDRNLIYYELLNDIWSWRCKYTECGCVIGGDFNTDLNLSNSISKQINNFIRINNIVRCDELFPSNVKFTYVNESLNHFSKVDYFLCKDVNISNFEIYEPSVNLSDHLPLFMSCAVHITEQHAHHISRDKVESVLQLRWDRADVMSYYSNTFLRLQPVLDELIGLDNCAINFTSNECLAIIDNIYEKIVHSLNMSASVSVPIHRKNFFKFWWSQELDYLKDRAIDSDKIWKAAGRPRSGAAYATRNKDKLAYRSAIRNNRRNSEQEFTNDLHESLLLKNGTDFWKSWNSKFNTKSVCTPQVEGLVDSKQIAVKFANHFATTCSNLSENGSGKLKANYDSQRVNYVGAPLLDEHKFDAELLGKVIADMKRGKAAGLDGLTIEHLTNCHPILPSILARLFNLIIQSGYVPTQFGLSYTVPLLKGTSNSLSKNLTCNDFRGISISPVLSKIFEHCILIRFEKYFQSSNNQFGFKKTVGCSSAIYIVRSVINHYVVNGSTVNLCALDVSKAFDKLNHCGLLIKLMQRGLPDKLLCILEDWFSKCFTCVKWNSVYSVMFKLNSGVRQGGVLSPFLFSVYVDDIVESVVKEAIGCSFKCVFVSIIFYADDILLLAPSVDSLQRLVRICEYELKILDLTINFKKSVCTRIGPRCDALCSDITTIGGVSVQWADTIRYLGVFIVCSRTFKCCFDHAKQSFYRAFNSVYGKIGRTASEEVILSLVKAKCLPCLLYGLDACPVNTSDERSLNFVIRRTLMKIFKTTSNEIISDCQFFFNFPDVSHIIKARRSKFLTNCIASDIYLLNVFGPVAQAELQQLNLAFKQ
jgi:hypothetical protein